ncbi:hypothetical protein I6B53_10705 [Schaalia sp. 19OD2882]|uniref:hypothetical protein n=1 Tax=Schaalia sp. 19OD2882 TaxID=2794089 RepID=UPI001C1EA845|nr:hypothetical protein [Schaalia sp. 19OD2882]QWW19527.1 hypothetical protein I6B53_10705 [Schaalia sp. 19OD2882]
MSESTTLNATRDQRIGRAARLRWGALACAVLMVPLFGGVPAGAAESSVLQTVDVKMGTDGAVASIEGTTLTVGVEGAVPAPTTYAPSEVAKDLPVRVRTSWKTEDKAGTDLNDLTGVTGPVTIDLTVENLTVRPQEVVYDVAGSARREMALVGVPLTIVASTALDASPNTVVTAGPDPSAVTNGVLSKDPEGKAVVQWATVLAPPRMGASTRLRLVVQAEDFKVPQFDLAIQRGYVTDPSSKAITAALTPGAPVSEAQLTAATIEVINEVNANVTKASEIVTKVKDDLDNSSQTLGTTTLRDLTASSKSLSETMTSTGTTIAALSQMLSNSLSSSESSTVSMLVDSINSVAATFGDTSRQVKPPAITGQGCAASVDKNARPEGQGPTSVYEGISDLTAYLHAYAGTTDLCRQAIVTQMLSSLGPDNPDDKTCANSASTTCKMRELRSSIVSTGQKMVADTDKKLVVLQPQIVDSVQSAGGEVSALVARAKASAADLQVSGADNTVTLDGLIADLNALHANLDARLDEVAGIRQSASGARQSTEDVKAQIAAMDQDLCAANLLELAQSGADQTSVDQVRQALEKARGHIASEGCSTWGSTPGQMPGQVRVPDLLATQDQNLSSILVATDPDQGGSFAARLSETRSAVDSLVQKVTALKQTLSVKAGDDTALRMAIADLRGQLANLSQATSDFDTQVGQLKDLHSTVREQVLGVARDASAELDQQTSGAINSEVRRITGTTVVAAVEVDSLMSAAANGVRGQGDSATSLTRDLIVKQQNQLAAQQDATRTGLGQLTSSAAKSVEGATSRATRDVEGARVLLGTDMSRLLADLGTPTQNGGTGFLGSVRTSAALASNATYQLALAEQTNQGFANVRSKDATAAIFQRAQIQASLRALAAAQPFHMPATTDQVTTIFTYTVGGAK